MARSPDGAQKCMARIARLSIDWRVVRALQEVARMEPSGIREAVLGLAALTPTYPTAFIRRVTAKVA